jgi:2-dehydro-3-deoxyphosphogluconate aldolase/(4S)-4-hydroxy-2-oxoglutarate aldolase
MEPFALFRLHQQRLISVIRAPTAQAALAAAWAVADGGISLIEVTFTVPDAPRVMAELSGRADVTLGAGTVLTTEQARTAIAAGAKFIVAPNFSPEVARITLDAGLMYCPGAYTAGEIITAHSAGAHVIKVYPVGVAGGPRYIEILRDPLPDLPYLAAGGTDLDNFIPFLRAGCIGVGLGGAIADPKLAAAGEFGEITRRAREFVRRLKEADLGQTAVRGAAT